MIQRADPALDALEERALDLGRRLAAAFPGATAPAIDTSPASDDLFAYGILGGKDVGKSTLVNALAEARIAEDGGPLAEGTRCAVVYLHRDDEERWRTRAARAGFRHELHVRTHARDVLRNVALVDLPDFDSRFEDHQAYVRDFRALLDGMIWMSSPSKYRDRAFQEELRRVHHEDFLFVLNKADWVVDKRREDTADALRRKFAAAVAEALGAPARDEAVFVISAAQRSFDFPRLQNAVVREHSLAEISRRKRVNRLRQLLAHLAALDRAYRVTEAGEAARALDEAIAPAVAAELGDDLRRLALPEIVELPGPNRRLSGSLLDHRLDGWPVLRVIAAPLRAGGAFLRQAVDRGRYHAERHEDYNALDAILDAGPRPLGARLARARDRLQPHFHRLAPFAGAPLDPPGDAELRSETVTHLRRALERHDRDRLELLRARHGPPGFLGRLAVWLVPVWFVFVQPIAETVLKVMSQRQAVTGVFEIAWRAVALLGASAMLKAAAMTLLVYAVLALKVISDCSRRVARDRAQTLETFWRERAPEAMAAVWRERAAPAVERALDRHRAWLSLRQQALDALRAP